MGTLLSAGASLLKGKGQKKQLKAQAEAAEYNARITAARAGIESLLAERAGARGLGATRADYGAAGLLGGGSASDVLRESARDINFQLESISRMSEMEQELYRKEAKAARTGGKYAMAGGVLDAVSALF